MPYSIMRHAEQLIWVVMEGHLTMHHAEGYFNEMWATLDVCPAPTDLLVDGRRIAGAAPGARRRTEQIAHHPNLGHLAFVVGEVHLLLFAPFVKLVSGVGLFGDEHEALTYLRQARGLPLPDLALPDQAPPHALSHDERHHAPPAHPARHHHEAHARHAPTRPMPPLPASRLKQTPIMQRNPPPRPPADSWGAGAGDGDSE